MGTRALELGAYTEAALLRQRAEALNFPRVGNRGNYYYSTAQLNLSPAHGSDSVLACKSKYTISLLLYSFPAQRSSMRKI